MAISHFAKIIVQVQILEEISIIWSKIFLNFFIKNLRTKINTCLKLNTIFFLKKSNHSEFLDQKNFLSRGFN